MIINGLPGRSEPKNFYKGTYYLILIFVIRLNDDHKRNNFVIFSR